MSASLPHQPKELHPTLAQLARMLEARYGAVAVTTAEEERFMDMLHGMLQRPEMHGLAHRIRTWSATEGLYPQDPKAGWNPKGPPVSGDKTTASLLSALEAVRDSDPSEQTLYVFRDLHPYLRADRADPKTVRALRDTARVLRHSNSMLVMVSSTVPVPPELEKEVSVLNFGLPTEAEFRHLVDSSYEDWERGQEQAQVRPAPYSGDIAGELARACGGLTYQEAEGALALGFYRYGAMNREMVREVQEIKQASLRRSGALEAIPVQNGLESVGGLDQLKAWVGKRQDALGERARTFGIQPPKGLLAVGLPGGGKSLSAQAVASSLRLPLIRFDVGAVMGSLVGESENNARNALRTIEALAPCVAWFDEVEKAFSGMGGGGRGDSGTSDRVFGTILTWMQERKAPVFLYFTANNIQGLPPELMRKGRVDELFFMDLPTAKERMEILEIHLRKRKREPARFDLPALAEQCRGFVGAEIEQGIVDAMYDAFAEGLDDITTAHIQAAFRRTTPLLRTQSQKILEMRRFVEEGRATRASSEVEYIDDLLPERAGVAAGRPAGPSVVPGPSASFGPGGAAPPGVDTARGAGEAPLRGPYGDRLPGSPRRP